MVGDSATCTHGHDAEARYRFQGESVPEFKCHAHAWRHPPLVRTAVKTSLVVGTILVTINQGNLLFAGEFGGALAWKIPLTYAVPYCVATWSALRISRLR